MMFGHWLLKAYQPETSDVVFKGTREINRKIIRLV